MLLIQTLHVHVRVRHNVEKSYLQGVHQQVLPSEQVKSTSSSSVVGELLPRSHTRQIAHRTEWTII